MTKLLKISLISMTLLINLAFVLQSVSAQSIDDIVNEINLLEKERDPKCYATASRLEDFMFGTPLSSDARFSKNLLQKLWAKKVWLRASELAQKLDLNEVSDKIMQQALTENVIYQQDADEHWNIKFNGGQEVRINGEDKRQYSTIAYALRAILAVQQEFLMANENEELLLPMQQTAINQLKDSLDLISLSVLKITDATARKLDQREVSKSSFNQVWTQLTKVSAQQKVPQLVASKALINKADLTLTKKVIKQKLESYAAYNQISNQLFLRNLQVYYARLSWPTDAKESEHFKQIFTETLIQFATDLYLGAEEIAIKKGNKLVTESDVYQMAQRFLPHNINEYEDAIFFPKLPHADRITIEAYDMDSFRDSGVHWRYLESAINAKNFNAKLQVDPFALELIVENIAQFGVLSLRVAGLVGISEKAERLETDFFINGLKDIQHRINRHANIETDNLKIKDVVSALENTKENELTSKTSLVSDKFSDVTDKVKIDAPHRSSDWLNRLLRSYLDKGEGVGVITIPPAFGGSGIAAEDINNDGYVDLLVLSGAGNKLFLNHQGKFFEDITQTAGLNWKRTQDNQPGEPRQPIIADFNNDGLQDILITYVNDAHRVYQNIGDAKFKDVTEIAKLDGINLVGGPATVADFDGDGLLDIYITYFGNYLQGVLPTLKRRNDNGLANQIFKNEGGFRFTNVTANSGAGHTGWAQAVTHTDFNLDGKQDLIVGNDFGVNAYLRNEGNFKFKDVSSQLGTDKPSYTMNIGIADLNADLLPDIYISNIVTMNKDEKYVLPNEETTMKFNADKLSSMRVVEANDLFLSQQVSPSNITYKLSDAVGRGYSSTGWSWGADFFDYDNDGDSDLYVLNGMNEFNLYSSKNPYYTDPLTNEQQNVYMPVSTKESNVFFINEGGRLKNSSQGSGIDLVGNSRSAAYLDFDNDGDLDIALNNYHEMMNFYVNNLEQKTSRWLKVKLIGDVKQKVNRDAIGAKLILTTTKGNTMWREIHGSVGYMTVHPKMQHFGLGAAEIENIKIIWPNGQEQIIKPTKINSEIIVIQDAVDGIAGINYN